MGLMAIRTVARQNWADLAVEQSGDMEGLFELAAANGMMPDELPMADVVLTVPTVVRPEVVDYFARVLGGYRIATEDVLAPAPGAFDVGFDSGFDS